MSDVAEQFDLDWPYMRGMGGNGGERSWDEIGDSLHEVVGMPVTVSSGYHQAKRKEGTWIVEPDSSLDPDDREDYGLEIVSPPMPLKQALEQLAAVTDWANGAGDAYTNQSTGLHMGVSIPYKEGNVDYLKLILFLGDEHVLREFERESNTYTKAAIRDIRSRAGVERNVASVMELMKNNLIELAERELVKGTGTGKYTSAHKQGKYIEFRSAGGDWLAKEDAEFGILENTMMRYAYAMYLAGRPDLERKEYAKKLYKLITENVGDDPVMQLFSQYAAGTIDKEQLKKQWAEKTLSKEVPEKKSNWKLYNNSTGQAVPGQEYNNFDYEDAHARAKQAVSPGSSVMDFDRAYTLRNVGEGTGQWRVYRGDNGETLEIINAETRNQAVEQAYEKYTGVIPFKIEPYNPDPKEKELSRRAKLAKQIAQPKPTWDVVYRPTGRVIDSIIGVSREEAQKLLPKVAQQHQFDSTDDLELHNQKDTQKGQSTNPRPTIQEPGQARASNGVPIWDLIDRSTGNVINSAADHTAREAWGQFTSYLNNIGAEDPNTFDQRFTVRPQMQS